MSDLHFDYSLYLLTDEPFLIQDLMDAWDGKVKIDELGREYADVDWDGIDTDLLRRSLDEEHSYSWLIAIMYELDDRYDGDY